MIRKHDWTRQPNSVMPPRPTHHAARRHSCIPLRPYTLLPQRISPIVSPPQSSVVHLQCNSFVSYGPATTMRRMQLLPDTNRPFSATNGVARPYLRCNRHSPISGHIRHDEIRQTLSHSQSPAIRRQFYTCVSYDSATTIRQIRHLPDTNHLSSDTKSVEMSNVLLSGPTTPPTPDSRPASRRNPPTTSRPRNLPSWNSLVQYEPATAVERMERLSDTNLKFTATNRVPRPIYNGTFPHLNSRPIRPNRHYETPAIRKGLSSSVLSQHRPHAMPPHCAP